MTVVVGVDTSPGWEAPILLADREASFRGSSLLAVSTYGPRPPLGAPAARPLATLQTSAEQRAAAEAELRDAVSSALGDRAGQVQLRVSSGSVGRAVVDAARRASADLIVCGGRTAASALPGSMSQYVLRHAPCPVLIVPDGVIAAPG